MDDTEDIFIEAELSDEEKDGESGEGEYYHQVDVRSLPRYYSNSDFKKLINKKLRLNGFNFKFYNPSNSPIVSVCFDSEAAMENAILVINKYVWRKKVLSAQKSSKPQKNRQALKRKSNVFDSHADGGGGEDDDDNDEDDDDEGPSSKKKKKQLMDPKLSVVENLRNSFVPLWKMEYKDQLKLKQVQAKKILRELADAIQKVNPKLTEWVQQQMSIHGGLPCELLDIRHAGNPTGYRNNCKFNLGLDPDTKQAAVGCKMHYYIDNFKAIAQPDGLMYIPDKIKVAAKAFQDMLRTKMSRYDVRYIRDLFVRTAKDQLLILINLSPSDRPREQRERFEKICIDYFTNGPGKSVGITSLFTQKERKKDIKSFHLWGERCLYEYPLNLKIKIFPNGFYATNSEAAEIFYKTAIELIGPVERSTVVDLCCGVGPLGLCFGKHCKEVLGVDTVKMCTNYATQNAALNNIKNAKYFTGRADDLTGNICQRAQGDDVVVVCDPPRSGLHEKAIFHLRSSPKVKKILYVSINPKAGMKVYQNLSKAPSGKCHGEPFVPTKAVVIDMTPHTKVAHLVTVWERWSRVKNRS